MLLDRFPESWSERLGEFVMVVAGVFVALAASAWWAGRVERGLERTYITQLSADVRANEQAILEAIAGDAGFEQRLRRVLRQLEGSGPLIRDSLGVHIGFSQFMPITGTYTALIQSGDINLIQDDSLRVEIMKYAGQMDAVLGLLQRSEDQTIRMAEVWGRKNWQLRPRGRAGQPRWADNANWDVLAADPEVLFVFDTQRKSAQLRQAMLRGILEPTRALRSRLEAAERN
jgi:hypothetical protein